LFVRIRYLAAENLRLTKKYIVTTGNYLLLFVFLQYYSGITMFYHAHLIDGHVIIHSHPYWPDTSGKKDPYQAHSHSKGELILIKHLNQVLWENGPLVLNIPGPFFNCLSGEILFHFDGIIQEFYSLPLLRAPPYPFLKTF